MLRKYIGCRSGTGCVLPSLPKLAVIMFVVVAGLMFAGTALAEEAATAPTYGLFGWILNYFAQNPFAYLFLALALGYPLGRLKVAGISLGKTAGVLVVGIAYLALLMAMSWVGALSVQVETLGTGGLQQMIVGVLKELIQPFQY